MNPEGGGPISLVGEGLLAIRPAFRTARPVGTDDAYHV